MILVFMRKKSIVIRNIRKILKSRIEVIVINY